MPAPSECPLPVTTPHGLTVPAATLVLGELHGTREVPAFVGSLVCNAATTSETVLALEIPHTEQVRIDAFLESNGDAQARADLLRGDFWDFPMQDGRRSAAMVSLLDAARRWRKHGAPLSIVAFDSDAPPDVRDAEMGQRLSAVRQFHPQALLVVVTGGVHASREPDAAFVPMAVHFTKLTAPHQIVALAMKHSGGQAWVCTDKCGPHEAAGKPDAAPPRIVLFERMTGGFDGAFHVGRISASAPAVAVSAP